MNETSSITVSLSSEWFILPGCEQIVLSAVAQLALEVERQEPGTLVYLAHYPRMDEEGLQSLPPQVEQKLLFFEVYSDAKAFLQHLNGLLFMQFVADYGSCFVSANGKPYTTVQFLSRHAGFMRVAPITEPTIVQTSSLPTARQHQP